MKANAILLSTTDNVVTVVDGAKQGEEIRYFANESLNLSLRGRQFHPVIRRRSHRSNPAAMC